MLRRESASTGAILVDGRAVPIRDGDSLASAILAAGIKVTRRTLASGAPRGPWCMMGACFDCAAIVDGRAGTRTCMIPARDGTRVETHGD